MLPPQQLELFFHLLAAHLGCKLFHSMAHGQIWGNDELTEEFRFKNVLKELIEKTLQLTVAPNLAMSHSMRYFFDNYVTHITTCLPKVRGFGSACEALSVVAEAETQCCHYVT
jgi:hypothetical protein